MSLGPKPESEQRSLLCRAVAKAGEEAGKCETGTWEPEKSVGGQSDGVI